MKRAILFGAILLVSGLAGCGGEADLSAKSASEGSAGAEAEGSRALHFEDIDTTPLRAFRGRVAVMELGCMGCGGSDAMYKELLALDEAYGEDVVFLRVDHGDSVEKTRPYYEKTKPTFHVFGDPSGKVGRSLPSQAMPTLYLFGKWGQMRFSGGLEVSAFKTMVDALRAESKPEKKNFFLLSKIDKGDTLPAFTLPDTEGKDVSVEAFRRDAQGLILVFAGTTCPISNQAVKTLASMADDTRFADLAILAVNCGPLNGEAEATYAKIAPPFPILVDAKESLTEKFGIEVVPTLIVADPDGVILLRSMWNPAALEQEMMILTGVMRPEDRREIQEEGTG
jgi:peroxiredoxin